jgi:hypothetical protein
MRYVAGEKIEAGDAVVIGEDGTVRPMRRMKPIYRVVVSERISRGDVIELSEDIRYVRPARLDRAIANLVGLARDPFDVDEVAIYNPNDGSLVRLMS